MAFSNLRTVLKSLFDDSTFSTAKTFGIESKAANGVTYSAEGEVTGNKLTGNIGASFDHENGFAIENIQLDNTGKLDAELALAKAVDNTVFKLNVTLQPLATNPADEEKTELVAEYSNDGVTVDVTVSPIEDVYANATVQYENDDLVAGATASVNKTESSVEISEYAFALGYKDANSLGLAVLSEKLSALSLSFQAKHSDNLSFAAEYETKLKSDQVASIKFGGIYTVDADTSYAATLAGSTASVNYSTRLNASTTLDLNTVVDLSSSDSHATSFGLKLGFSA